MSVIEKLSVISDTITKVMNFVLTSDIIKPDFDEYIAALSAKNADTSRIQALLIPYIAERRLTKDRKTVIELFLDNTKNITDIEKEILAFHDCSLFLTHSVWPC